MEPVKAHLSHSYTSFIYLCTVHQHQQAYQCRVELVCVFDCRIGDLSAVRVQISVAVFERDDGEDGTQCFTPFPLFT